MGVEPKIGVVNTTQIIPFVHRVWNPYFHHPFWGTIFFGNTQINCYQQNPRTPIPSPTKENHPKNPQLKFSLPFFWFPTPQLCVKPQKKSHQHNDTTPSLLTTQQTTKKNKKAEFQSICCCETPWISQVPSALLAPVFPVPASGFHPSECRSSCIHLRMLDVVTKKTKIVFGQWDFTT